MSLVLVVDDKDDSLYFLRALLVGHGYEVVGAKNGAEAIAAARRQLPDLVISDILMPVMDGFNLCRQWKRDPDLERVPFIFYTATYTDPKDEELALSLGADRFVVKPIEPDAFLGLIGEVLVQQRRGELTPKQATAAPEEEYLREYNAVLIHKLEDKLGQLELVNRRLADKHTFNQAVLNAMNALLAVVGPDGRVLMVNSAWARFAAQPDAPAAMRLDVGDDALAEHGDGSAQTVKAGRVRDELRQVLAGHRSQGFELPYGDESDPRWFVVRIEPVHIAGVAAIIACTDITNSKRAERAAEDASRRKDEFLAVLGHELRNPLGPIKTAASVLGLTRLDEPMAERARQIIDRQTTHLARIVDDLLDVARISRGRLTLERTVVDLREVVRTATEDWRLAFEQRGIRLMLGLPDEPAWVRGDPVRLAQIVGNLLSNAEKFTDGQGEVELRVEPDGEGWSRLIVRDNGIGMSAETLHRLFYPFEQAPQESARTRGGLGMGLALVKGLVELHGGEIQASSAGPARGSQFDVRLPRATPAPQREAPAQAGDVPGARILLIEDNRDAADSLRTFLEMTGHSVEVAHDGQSGLELARRYRPETVLCDIGLPGGMDGYDVARALRGDPVLRSAHLLALTGYGQEEDRRRAHAAGFDALVKKPAEPRQLLRLMASFSRRRRGEAGPGPRATEGGGA